MRGIKQHSVRNRRSTSRFGFVPRSLAIAATAATLLLSATVSGGGPSAGASAGINPNGVLKYGFDLNNEFANDFDPGTEVNDCSYTVYQNIFESVTAPGQKAIVPGVAQSWTITNNASTVTLHIRPNMVFSNGDPVTATDVELSLEHTKISPLRSSLSAISSMTVVDPLTLVVNLNRPTAGDFLWAMTYIDGSVMDPPSIGSSLHPIGAGPFMLKSYSQGSFLDLIKNPKFFDSKAYPLGGVDFIEVATGAPSVSALTSGAVDMVQLSPEDVPAVRHNPNITVTTTQSYDYMLLQMRENRAPFNNPKVRAALEYAVDRPAINATVYQGLGQPAFQPFPSTSPGYNKQIGNSYSYQPKKAKAMLAAAGFPHGLSFKLIVPGAEADFDRAATILQSSMAAAGFKANIQEISPADLLTDVYFNGEGDALLSDDLTNGPDISNNFESEYESTGFVAHYLGETNAAISALTLKANSSLSPSVQGPLMKQAVKDIMSQGLEVPIEFIPSIVAYNKNVVGGHVVAPIGNCRSNLAGIYIKK